MAEVLRERVFSRSRWSGSATDYCVRASALDAVGNGVTDGARPA